MPTTFSLNFQDSNNTYMQHMNMLHDHMMLIISLLLIAVSFWILLKILQKKNWSEYLEENDVELFWTALPSMFLTFLLMPSIMILYMIEDFTNPSFTVKATSNQWYWSYTYPEIKNLSYDSFMKQNSKLRLLEVTNNMIAPSNMWVRVITSSNDVIHSWAIPSLGLKIDSIPGRLNTTSFKSKRSGYLTGQCSEICGMNHSFMPIMLHLINPKSLPILKNYTKKPLGIGLLNRYLVNTFGESMTWKCHFLKKNSYIPQLTPQNWLFLFMMVTMFILNMEHLYTSKTYKSHSQKKNKPKKKKISW